MSYHIYTLEHPVTGEIRYVGKTNNISKRLSRHCKESSNTHKANWITGIRNLGLKPVLKIVDSFETESECYEAEIYWISQFKSWGFRLVNLNNGGIGADSGENNSNAKTTERDVIGVCELLMKGKLHSEIVKVFPNITAYHLSDIRTKRTWRHITSKYTFPPVSFEYRKGKATHIKKKT